LIAHVSARSPGIVSGAAALSVAKGQRLHRAFGTLFSVTMLAMGAIAMYLAVLVPEKLGNLGGGAFTIYLVATGWMTARRKEGSIGLFEKVGPSCLVWLTTA
jgi:uncharacterized membrane protein